MISIKEYDFYNPKNIFIWGVDDLQGLVAFLNSPYEPIENNILKSYTFEGWLNNIYMKMGWDINSIYEE